MARVVRIDTGSLAKPVRRADGTIVVEARLSRTGVYTYRNPDGSERREYRPESEVFSKASMDSFKLVPVTNGHPPQMLTAQNARQYSVGAVGENIRRDGIWLVAPLAVHDAATIRDMESGKVQVSCGYECDLVMKAGVSPNGERYDAEQTVIAGNHLAIEHSARAGQDAAARMDAGYQESQGKCAKCDKYDALNDSGMCATCADKGKKMDLAQALAALHESNVKLGKLTERIDSSDKEIAANKAQIAKLEAERDSARERADKADKARKDAEDAQGGILAARAQLIADATAVIGKTVRVDGADKPLALAPEKIVKLAVIKRVTNVDCSDKNDAYIDVRFDMALEQAANSADTFRGAQDLIQRGRDLPSSNLDKKRQDAASEYDKMVDENRNGWMKPVLASK